MNKRNAKNKGQSAASSLSAEIAAAQFQRFTFRCAIALLILVSLPEIIHAQFAKTITVIPNVQVNAVTTWYYANCTTVLGVGSYSVNVVPQHGTLSFSGVSGPIPGCPTGSPSLPAVAAFYTWTDTTSEATADYFQLLYQVNGLSQVQDITVELASAPAPDCTNLIDFDYKQIKITTNSAMPADTVDDLEEGADGPVPYLRLRAGNTLFGAPIPAYGITIDASSAIHPKAGVSSADKPTLAMAQTLTQWSGSANYDTLTDQYTDYQSPA